MESHLKKLERAGIISQLSRLDEYKVDPGNPKRDTYRRVISYKLEDERKVITSPYFYTKKDAKDSMDEILRKENLPAVPRVDEPFTVVVQWSKIGYEVITSDGTTILVQNKRALGKQISNLAYSTGHYY